MAETTAAAPVATTPAQTPVQTAPAAPQQTANEPAKGSGAPLKAPLIPDPKAFLERARARQGWKVERPAESAKPAETAKPAEPVATQAAPAAEPKPAEAKPADPVDEMAERVARFSREKRELDQQRRTFEEAQAKAKTEREEAAKQHETKLRQAETVEKAAKAIEAGDVIGAIRALKADVNPSAFALQLLEQLQKEDERPMSQAEVDRMIAERLKTEQAAREKAAEEKRKADEESKKQEDVKAFEAAKDNYVAVCKQLFSREKFPFIAKRGISKEMITEHLMSVRDDMGRLSPPGPDDLLRHFEEKYKSEAEIDGYVLVPKSSVAAPAPTASPSFSPTSLVQDSGGRLAPERPRRTLEEDRAEIRRKLRVGGTQT